MTMTMGIATATFTPIQCSAIDFLLLCVRPSAILLASIALSVLARVYNSQITSISIAELQCFNAKKRANNLFQCGINFTVDNPLNLFSPFFVISISLPLTHTHTFGCLFCAIPFLFHFLPFVLCVYFFLFFSRF